nr:CHAT domain-containing protein [Acidobacteriota bacterium]
VLHLRQLVDQARAGESLGSGGLDWVSRRLYRLLVRPAEPWLARAERVLIVPDGPLHLLPFAALLRDEAAAEPARREGRYLIEWKPLHTALSGTVYAELQKRRRGPRGGAGALQWVGFGDPWFPPRLAQGRLPETAETRLRSFTTRSAFQWQRLPESRREVERIAELFPRAARRVYLDREATEERAKALGPQARIVHFATHGFVDDLSPFDSGLVLAIPEELGGGRDNGLLQVWEIFEGVRLDADLVVLSACETGLGKIRGGEGIIGLTRAFQFAGARSVLASLWQVEDRATAELMERFYRHLRAGTPKDLALRAAQLELLSGREGRPGLNATAPYQWAAMQLYGDWQ